MGGGGRKRILWGALGAALVGTVVASDARWSRASILADGERLLSRVGDRLPDGSRLVRILNNRVVLRSASGQRWTLRLEERPAVEAPPTELPPAEDPPSEDPREAESQP